MPPSFDALGVPAPLVRALTDRGITDPFPIQALTLPDALAGRDVCGRAPTGSGKTLAFGIPLAVRVTNAAPKKPKALVLVPTRELAAQVRDELTQLLAPFGRTVHAFYGGVGFGAQRKALRSGVDVAVACPGRLEDLISQGDVRLDRVTTVVLDEADRMADMGFLPAVRRLLDQVADDRQTLLFSATLDGDVDVLIRRYQRHPVRHGVDKDADEPVNRHVLWRAEREEKLALTAEIVRAHWPAIVFSRTKHGADRIARQLGRHGVDAVAIHGNRSQGQRERALRDFTSARAQALVATDVAARGIHVDGVACVVHFDAPPDHKDFVHRSGRTGRAGAEGLVVTLSPRDDVRTVAKMMGKAGLTGVVAEDPDVDALGRPAPVPERPSRPAATADGDVDDRSRRSGGGSPNGRGGRRGNDGGSRRGPAGSGGRGRGKGSARGGSGRDRDERRDRVDGDGRGGARGRSGARADDGRGRQRLDHEGRPRRSGGRRQGPGGGRPGSGSGSGRSSRPGGPPARSGGRRRAR